MFRGEMHNLRLIRSFGQTGFFKHWRRDKGIARLELRSETVATKSTGVPYDHVQEVEDAQRRWLLNRINRLISKICYPQLSEEARLAAVSELGQASELLDLSERYVPR